MITMLMKMNKKKKSNAHDDDCDVNDGHEDDDAKGIERR